MIWSFSFCSGVNFDLLSEPSFDSKLHWRRRIGPSTELRMSCPSLILKKMLMNMFWWSICAIWFSRRKVGLCPEGSPTTRVLLNWGQKEGSILYKPALTRIMCLSPCSPRFLACRFSSEFTTALFKDSTESTYPNLSILCSIIVFLFSDNLLKCLSKWQKQ